jgi:hypothetical protein
VKKMLFVVLVVFVLALTMVAPAVAHNVHVNTPSGQSNCQFLGGPGNPGHPGHSEGHPQAIAHEQSETVTISFASC